MPHSIEVAEGHQGQTRFFTGTMTWGELDQMVVFPDELASELEEEGEDEQRMQRGLSTRRIPDLVDYLTLEKDHFFSAVTLIVLPRDLRYPSREVEGEGEDGDFYFQRAPASGFGRQTRGALHLSGNVRLFPADGQHRLKGAMEAIQLKRSLAKEHVPVVLVPYEGPDQVRQLFSDLNLNAKPVNKTIGYDFDRRTITVQLAKQVAEAIPLFQGRVNRISNSLSRTSNNVITMNALVEGTRTLVGGFTGKKEPRELDRAVEQDPSLRDQVIEAWEVIVGAFSDEWDRVLDTEEPYAAGNLRDQYVFPHGLGWQALTLAAAEVIRRYPDEWQGFFTAAVTQVNWSRDNSDWQGIAMAEDRVNNTGPGIRGTANYILERVPGAISLT
jgi:DNA sulfur modification protein DndB